MALYQCIMSHLFVPFPLTCASHACRYAFGTINALKRAPLCMALRDNSQNRVTGCMDDGIKSGHQSNLVLIPQIIKKYHCCQECSCKFPAKGFGKEELKTYLCNNLSKEGYTYRKRLAFPCNESRQFHATKEKGYERLPWL